MKTKPTQVKRPTVRRTKLAKSGSKRAPTLPDWVIGVYDGPKDQHLSTKEGYSR